MFVDSDYEELDPVDTSYGYAKESKNSFASTKKEFSSSSSFESPHEVVPSQPEDFPSDSFLARSSTDSAVSMNHAQRCALDAECSKEAVASLSDCLPSAIETRMKRMTATDRRLLDEQLGREAISLWDTSSIYSNLGVDENGNVLGLSLNRLNDLLCNANEHLLIIRREIIRHQKQVEDARAQGLNKNLGFHKSTNRQQLQRACRSLSHASKSLAVHVDALAATVENASSSVSTTSISYALRCGIILTFVAGCAFYIFHRK